MTDYTRIPGASSMTLHKDRNAINETIEKILADIERAGYPQSSIFAIRLALEEAITNAFEHGHESLSDDVPILIDYAVDQDQVCIAIEDQGPGFDPDKLPDPTLDENLSKPSGRGVMLMRAYMTEVVFSPTGNRVHMRYVFPANA